MRRQLARLGRSWALRLAAPGNLFQPWNDTCDDRYPDVFDFLARHLPAGDDVHVLSFGCSTGEEVFSLRRALPAAHLKGIDISRGNVAECRRRLHRLDEHRIEFVRAGSVGAEPDGCYDAVLCMAVFRHGSLAEVGAGGRCDHLLAFDAFAESIAELVRCLKPGGFLVVEHSNFRVADTAAADQLDVVLRRPLDGSDRRTPIFGADNRRLPPSGEHVDLIFRKSPPAPARDGRPSR